MNGSKTAAISAMIASTQTISSRVKPCLACSFILGRQILEGDVGRDAAAALLAVGSIGHNVIGTVLTRRAIDVSVIPGIAGNVTALQIRSIPGSNTRSLFHQRAQSFCTRRIAAGIEIKQIERSDEALQLDPRGLDLGFAEIVEHARTDQAHDQADDRDHDEHFDQREAGLTFKPTTADIGASLCPAVGMCEGLE